jgi:transposase
MQKTEAQEKLYCGADLHGNNVLLSLCDQQGHRVMERRVKANLEAVSAALDPHRERIAQVAVESTYNWYWFVDGLRSQGLDVRLANPAKMDQYEGLKSTDDSSDAGWIAEQMRLGILPESYIYPPEVRPIRDALRRRMLIVRQRTQTLLSLEGLFARYGWSCPGAKALKQWTAKDVESMQLEPFTRLQVDSLLELLRKQEGLARWIEEKVLQRIKPTPEYQRIQQVPGIGMVLGMVVVLESGDFKRFASAGNYASYCRTVKSQRRSNQKNKGQNNRKNGNKYLAWAFTEAAAFAIRFYPRIAAWYERKKRRRNVPVAMKALACKLAKAAWHVMQGQEFDEAMLFG